MSQYYNQDYTHDEISLVLADIHQCVRNKRIILSRNDKRKENQEFIEAYKITFDMVEKILLGIKAEDFCHSLRNTNKGYEHEILYVFVPQVQLVRNEKIETVDIYTKFNILDLNNGKRTVVISFHKRNKPIDYKFK